MTTINYRKLAEEELGKFASDMFNRHKNRCELIGIIDPIMIEAFWLAIWSESTQGLRGLI